MSTNSVIARRIGREWVGRYHHWDGYPGGVGKALFELYNGHFEKDIGAMLKTLIDDHPAGWSNIVDVDFSLEPGYENPSFDLTLEERRALPQRPQCYCHGARSEEGQLWRTGDDLTYMWLYVIDSDSRCMEVIDSEGEPVGIVDLDGPEPYWARMER